MAITFLEKRQRLQYLIPVLIGLLLVTLFVVWQGYFVKEEIPTFIEPFKRPLKKVEINFQLLKDPIFQVLQPFEEISPPEEELGREDPFTPHQIEEIEELE
jgi:hypothetical protein